MPSFLAWHLPALEQLGARRASDRLPHAILLVVGSDEEATALARALPYYLLCDSHNVCGQCRACRLLEQGAYSDHYLCQPEGTSKMIRIDQIRALLSVGAKTANYHAGKLLVLAPASALNRNAANALLKFLEEPPANTYLLLVASRTSELPATVISRCQRVSVERPSAVQALEFLREGGLSEGRSLELMNLANGEPLVALQIEESGSADTLLRVLNVVEALLNGHASARDLGREAQGIDADLLLMVLIAGAHQAAVAAVNQELMPSNWLSWHKALVELYGKYLRSPNINIPLALEQLCVTIR